MRTVIKQMRRLAKVLKDNPKRIGGGKQAGKERMKELEEMKNPPKQTKTKKSENPARDTKKSRKEAYETYMDEMSTRPARKPYADDISDPRLTYEDRVELLGGKYKKGGKVKKMQAGGIAGGNNTQAEIEKLDRQIEMLRRQAAEQSQAVPQRSRLGGVPGAMKALGGPQGRGNLGGMKKGGKVKKGYHKMPDGRIMKDSAHKGMKKGGKVSSCSKRADGCAVKGKTKGRMV